jgi:hypothetical protein
MNSIFRFWRDLASNKDLLLKSKTLSSFPFDYSSFSYAKNGRGFPNFSIKVNDEKSVFTGGEMVKIKNRNKYLIAPFKSSIPAGRVNIKDFMRFPANEKIKHQMENAGDDVFSLEERDVYYLIRGRKGKAQKICLVHGSFFETISTKELIRQSFKQVLDENLEGTDVPSEVRARLDEVFSEQEDFSRVRNVDKASVKLRFRIMTEVKPEGNILNSHQYPDIKDNTLNLVVPYHGDEEKADVVQKAEFVMGGEAMKQINTFSLKHPLNGWFVVFQVNL